MEQQTGSDTSAPLKSAKQVSKDYYFVHLCVNFFSLNDKQSVLLAARSKKEQQAGAVQETMRAADESQQERCESTISCSNVISKSQTTLLRRVIALQRTIKAYIDSSKAQLEHLYIVHTTHVGTVH